LSLSVFPNFTLEFGEFAALPYLRTSFAHAYLHGFHIPKKDAFTNVLRYDFKSRHSFIFRSQMPCKNQIIEKRFHDGNL